MFNKEYIEKVIMNIGNGRIDFWWLRDYEGESIDGWSIRIFFKVFNVYFISCDSDIWYYIYIDLWKLIIKSEL